MAAESPQHTPKLKSEGMSEDLQRTALPSRNRFGEARPGHRAEIIMKR